MISKHSVMSRLTEKDAATFREICAGIDQRLNHYDGVHAIAVALPRDCSESVVERIRQTYTAPKAGWTVTRNSGDDCREGSWDNLVFS